MQSQTWHKEVLLPFLAIDIAAAIAYIAFIGNLMHHDFETSTESTGGRAFVLAVGCAALLFDLLAATLWARQRLTPRTMVVANATKTAVWIILLFVDLVVSLDLYDFSSGVWIFQAILVLCALGQLIYASVMLHRQRRSTPPKNNVSMRSIDRGVEGDMSLGSCTGPSPFKDPARASSPINLTSKSTEYFEELRSSAQSGADEPPPPEYKPSVAVVVGVHDETKKPAPEYWSNV